jgi:endonuclease G
MRSLFPNAFVLTLVTALGAAACGGPTSGTDSSSNPGNPGAGGDVPGTDGGASVPTADATAPPGVDGGSSPPASDSGGTRLPDGASPPGSDAGRPADAGGGSSADAGGTTADDGATSDGGGGGGGGSADGSGGGGSGGSADAGDILQPHLILGIPHDSDPSDDVILNHGYFVISYNPKKNDPNWVAWRHTAADMGSAARQDNFHADTMLPAPFYQVTDTDYKGSGYDRGHMCPSADRTSTVDANTNTFVMTNMQPQLHNLNAGPWEALETLERTLTANQKDVYIVAGGIFDASPATIGPGIAVPKANFKIIVVLDPGQGPADVTDTTPIYAAIMPNDATATGSAWGQYATSVDDIEAQTGYDFLSLIPDPVDTTIEAKKTSAP